MTNKEAIENLKVFQDMACTMMFVDSDPVIKSVSEAIKALEREETCVNRADYTSNYDPTCLMCSKCGIYCHSKEGIKWNYCPNCGRRVVKEEKQ